MLCFQAQEVLESGGIYALQDNGGPRYDVVWFGENDSDAESVDSEEEDLLRFVAQICLLIVYIDAYCILVCLLYSCIFCLFYIEHLSYSRGVR